MDDKDDFAACSVRRSHHIRISIKRIIRSLLVITNNVTMLCLWCVVCAGGSATKTAQLRAHQWLQVLGQSKLALFAAASFAYADVECQEAQKHNPYMKREIEPRVELSELVSLQLASSLLVCSHFISPSMATLI